MLEAGRNADLVPGALKRVSYILRIYRAAHIIFPEPKQADGWVRRPNSASLFQGSTALALMCSGRIEDLAAVRNHLDAGGLLDP
ncbi:MbcA/ParS/Xre antitoxin family protein [Stenotrophomonas rhizophila]|uniref:MbcA/ParS/Xre antitoxin family protein n=1 Tax=Stenotrophomonas rhizophila TaxID=216778 RepID=UPI003D18B9A1